MARREYDNGERLAGLGNMLSYLPATLIAVNDCVYLPHGTEKVTNIPTPHSTFVGKCFTPNRAIHTSSTLTNTITDDYKITVERLTVFKHPYENQTYLDIGKFVYVDPKDEKFDLFDVKQHIREYDLLSEDGKFYCDQLFDGANTNSHITPYQDDAKLGEDTTINCEKIYIGKVVGIDADHIIIRR